MYHRLTVWHCVLCPGRAACRRGEQAPCKLPVWSPQVEGEKQQEHELQRLREHLAMLLGALLEAKHLSLGCSEAGGWEAGTLGPGPEPAKAAELLQRCEALERKTATFENIVCVLNREVERVAMTAEACGRQHRLDQDRIEALSNKVCAWNQGVFSEPGLWGQRLDFQHGVCFLPLPLSRASS